MAANSALKKSIAVSFAGHTLILDASGALYWPAKKILVVADLHLEKGSYFAKKANPLPLYDVLDTLSRLKALIECYRPEQVISLGDNIHDADSFNRMTQENALLLASVMESVPSWIWIVGNHDKTLYPHPQEHVAFVEFILIHNILFSHEFVKDQRFQIIGHFHPKIKLQQLSGPCFLVGVEKMIMPAFGCYAGGLNIDAHSFKKILAMDSYQIFLMYRKKIWRVR